VEVGVCEREAVGRGDPGGLSVGVCEAVLLGVPERLSVGVRVAVTIGDSETVGRRERGRRWNRGQSRVLIAKTAQEAVAVFVRQCDPVEA
jgi:hypothetical protein